MATPHRTTVLGCTGTLEKAATMHGATWSPLPSSLASGNPKSMSQARM